MSSSRKLLKGCVRLVLFLGFLLFLMVEAHHHHHHQEARIRGFGVVVMKKLEGSGKMKQDFVEAVKRNKKHKLEINYTTKRRVPNGSDPIHNRRAGKSHRSPGHA